MIEADSTALTTATDAAPASRWAHWPQRTESSYYAMFYDALRVHGVCPVTDFEPTREWVDAGRADMIHIHWPDRLWRRGGKRASQRAHGVWLLRAVLAAAKNRGMKIVWTVHNHEAHEGSDWIDALGYATVARQADLVICHSQWSARQVGSLFTVRGRIVVMPHGNFNGFQAVPRPQALAVTDWGLDPSRPLLTCLGLLREYKGLELACQAVAMLPRDVQLVIGGPPARAYDLAPLRAAVAALPHARLVDRRLTDQEFADLTAWSDVALLPYLTVTTSSALLGAWSQGAGVITPDLPYFAEQTQHAGEAAASFRTGDAADLARAIEGYLSIPRARRQAAARQHADSLSWATCVNPVAEWLRTQS